MTISSSIQNAINYLVPSSGGTHAVPVVGVFSGTPYAIDWRQFSIDEFPFQPQGIFIDNSLGAGPLTITIQPINWNVTCPAGAVMQSQFPAPDGQTASIVGDGQASVVFVDFPVLPNAGAVQILGTANVNIASPNPLPVLGSVNASGVPYQATEVPVLTTAYQSIGVITGATLSTTITPAANTYLRRLIATFTGNAAMAVAGLNTLTATLNGVIVYEENVYLPVASANVIGAAYRVDLDMSKLGLAAGAGDLVVTLGTALSAGELDINAYFG